MLVNGRAWEDEIREKLNLVEYDLNYQWINGCWGSEIFSIPTSNYDFYCFASVNENDELIGAIMCEFNRAAASIQGLWAVSFADENDFSFGQDLLSFFDKMFYEYNFNRIEWSCYMDNPARVGYVKLCKRLGGRVIGIRHMSAMLMDGKLHDSAIFEVMREDYVSCRNKYLERRNRK